MALLLQLLLRLMLRLVRLLLNHWTRWRRQRLSICSSERCRPRLRWLLLPLLLNWLIRREAFSPSDSAHPTTVSG